MSIEVSVIVPIYNSEKYLEQTLDSLLNQTLKSIEIICVNDGSTDSSLDILKRYEKENPNIVVVDSINKGVWHARKLGISYAKGNYVAFCDSDDIVESNMYETMLDIIKKEKSDMVVCGFDRINNVDSTILSREMTQFKNKTYFGSEKLWIYPVINTSLWNKLIRKEIIVNTIDFETPPRVMEDTMFLASIYPVIKCISFCDSILYHYIVRPGTAMTYIRNEEICTIIKDMVLTRQFIMSKHGERYMYVIDSMAFIHLGLSLLSTLAKTENPELRKIFKYVKKVLNKNFPQCRSLKISKVDKEAVKYIWKICFAKFMFNIGIFVPLIKLYNFIIQRLNIEIKW